MAPFPQDSFSLCKFYAPSNTEAQPDFSSYSPHLSHLFWKRKKPQDHLLELMEWRLLLGYGLVGSISGVLFRFPALWLCVKIILTEP